MFFRKKKLEEISGEQRTDEHALYVHVSEEGWRSRVVDPDGAVVENANESSAPEFKLSGVERTEYIIKDLAKFYTKRRLRKVGAIHLLLDESEVEFLDGKQQSLKNLNPAMLRETGALQLNVEQVTYGERTFGSAARREGRNVDWDPDGNSILNSGQVFAFMEADKLENFLGLLDATALKVGSVVPVIDSLLRRIETRPDKASGAIYLSVRNTYLAMGYPEFGMAASRVIPFGWLTFVEKLSEAQSVPVSDALKALANKDFISSIDVKPASKSSDEMTQSVYDRVLAPEFEKYFREISRTINYFSEQRGAGVLAAMEAFGNIDALAGMRKFLEANIDAPLRFSEETLLDLFPEHVRNGVANLLSGSDGSLLTVGKAKYSYFENRFIETEELMQRRAEIEISESTKTAGGRVAKLKRRRTLEREPTAKETKSEKMRSGRSKSERPAQGKKRSGLFGLGKYRADAATPQRSSTRYETANVARRQDRGGFMLVGLVAFGALYLGWTQYESVSITHSRSVSALATKITMIDKVRRDLDRTSFIKVSDLPQADKVLWSEKFISLASNMDKAMWLTDVYLSDENRRVGSGSVTSKKLVLEGAVLPSTDGHILNIAKYINRLLKDTQFFMSDFREITFEGAEIDASENDHVVRFTLEAWYDENKRIEIAKKVGLESPPTLDQTQKIIGEKNKKLNELVTPNFRN